MKSKLIKCLNIESESTEQFFGMGQEEALTAIECRVSERVVGLDVVVQMAERYERMTQEALGSLEGLLTKAEWLKLLDSNPTDFMQISEVTCITESVLGPEEEYWDTDPYRTLADKLCGLAFTQKVAICDLIERSFRGKGGESDLFEMAEKCGLVFAADEVSVAG